MMALLLCRSLDGITKCNWLGKADRYDSAGQPAQVSVAAEAWGNIKTIVCCSCGRLCKGNKGRREENPVMYSSVSNHVRREMESVYTLWR